MLHLAHSNFGKMYRFLSVLIVICILSSCTYEEKFAFNKRWSCVYTATLDMTEMEPDKANELVPFDEARALETKINAIDGISKARILEDREKSLVHFSYSFDNLKAINRLNKADLSTEKDSPLKGLGQWEMKNKGGRKFYMTMSNLEDKQSEIDANEVKRMGESFKIKTVLQFRKKVKILKGDIARKGENDREVIIEYSPADMWNPEISWDIMVKI